MSKAKKPELDLTLAEERYPADGKSQQAMLYLLHLLMGKKKGEIAQELGISRTTLYRLEQSWEEDGTLERVHGELLRVRVQAVQVAIDEVLREWPQIILEAKRIALHSASDRIRLEAIEWLHQRIVQPISQRAPDSSAKELAYASSHQEFDPQSIPDSTVIVETKLPTIITQKT